MPIKHHIFESYTKKLMLTFALLVFFVGGVFVYGLGTWSEGYEVNNDGVAVTVNGGNNGTVCKKVTNTCPIGHSIFVPTKSDAEWQETNGFIAMHPQSCVNISDCLVGGGICGSSNGGYFQVAPTIGLCSTGDASTVSGSGPWTWTCTYNSNTAGCTANLYIPNGSLSGDMACYTGVGSAYDRCYDHLSDEEVAELNATAHSMRYTYNGIQYPVGTGNAAFWCNKTDIYWSYWFAGYSSYYPYSNKLTSLPSGLADLANLKTLDVSSNAIQSLPRLCNLQNLTALNVQSNSLTTLPSDLNTLRNLKTLDAHINNLTGLPNLSGLSNLSRLYLGHNSLTSLPDSINDLSNLHRLDIESNALHSLPEFGVGKLTKLNYLYANAADSKRGISPYLTTLPDSINNLTGLQYLDVSANHLASLPTFNPGALVSLQTLNASWNHDIATLPDSINNLPALQYLDLNRNALHILPDFEANKLVNLQHLDVYYNYLTGLTSTINNLPALQYLDVGINDLPSLPDFEANKLVNLQHLNLGYQRRSGLSNGLTVLPNSINNLSGLERLNVSSNQLTTLPNNSNLTKIQHLDVSDNKLTTLLTNLPYLTELSELYINENPTLLPNQVSLTSNTKLYELNASNNKWITIPDFSPIINSLKSLNIGGNSFSPSLPSGVFNLVNLTTLRINNMSGFLTNLPDLSPFSNLQSLIVYTNNRTTLPSSVSNLTKLRFLHASNNRLTTLPDLSNLTNLGILYINNNQLTGLGALNCAFIATKGWHSPCADSSCNYSYNDGGNLNANLCP